MTNEEELKVQLNYIDKLKSIISKKEDEKGRKLTANVVNFGCQMNARDAEKLAGVLSEIGFVFTESEEADFVIYNTCTVRDNANQRVYGRLGFLKTIKKKQPDMKIALCGCMMQEASVIEKLQKSYRFVNLVFGTHNIFKFPELLYQMYQSDRMIVDIWQETDRIVEALPVLRKYPFKSGVNIMFGCNNFCSYCIVPYVRGRERSRTWQEIIAEIEALSKDGVIEVMLLGQNVNSYGKGLEDSITFAELLKKVEAIEGIQRIRFMTSHPKDLSDELIDVMAHSEKICKHIHLPLQSGSSKILKAMNRRYTKEDYLRLVDKLRTAIPDISITTDIIVGFPGETDADVDETIDVVKKAGFDNAFTFQYSIRSGTPAALMEQCREEDVKRNFDRLLSCVQDTARERACRFEGQTLSGLIEEFDEETGMLKARLSNNMICHIVGDASLIGTIKPIFLKENHGFYYIGEIKD